MFRFKTSLRPAALKLATVALAAAGAAAVLPAPALAGEGHWSIGHGVQCRLVPGVVVCSSNRP